MIDVIVPIYNGVHVLKNCLESLEKHQKGIDNIYLINDASTDEKIKAVLEYYIKNNKWNLIEHEKNQGFVKTANEGLKLSDQHTLLLNSDTVVTKNWIRSFKQCIERVDQLGTATAWSNNAEICSFPQFLKNNKIPKRVDRLSVQLSKNYKATYPEIPTAVGFCMLISKSAKQKIGYFDEDHFGHGYGEENDYSLRIKEAGLKNVLCDNAYVAHIGNVSFVDLGLKPDMSTMSRLLEKHPSYNDLIQEYLKSDPLASIREKILETFLLYDYDLYVELIKNGK